MSKDTKSDPIADVGRIFEASLPKAEPGGYAKYVDDDDPSAGVVFCRADGTRIMWMTTEAYFALSREMGKR